MYVPVCYYNYAYMCMRVCMCVLAYVYVRAYMGVSY